MTATQSKYVKKRLKS